MNASEIVRAARRRTGYSQRDLAALADVAQTTLSLIESGRRNPRVHVLDRILAAAGLDLVLAERLPDPASPELVAYLSKSTSQRLWESLGGSGKVRVVPRTPGRAAAARLPPVFAALADLARAARLERRAVALLGRSALGVWLPDHRPALPMAVHVNGGLTHPYDPQLLAVVDDGPSCGLTGVGVSELHLVAVETPCSLVAHVDCAPERDALRQVARVLYEAGARDDAGRRVPAHRDADEYRERWWVFHTHALAKVPLPDLLDSRAWRLGAEASLTQWLRERGAPD